MHELAVTQSVLEIVERHAQQAGAARVTDIFLCLGSLSSIVDDSVQFYWEVITTGTICECSKLHFSRIPAKVLCLDCQTEYTLDHDLIPCPSCGSPRIKIVAGDEFRVDSIEIEKESESR